MLCPNCGNRVDSAAQACPFCFYYTRAEFSDVRTSSVARTSLISGLLFFLFPAAILAVVTGHISLSEIRRSHGRLRGEGMAVAGLVLGYGGVASALLFLVLIALGVYRGLHPRSNPLQESEAIQAMHEINSACEAYAAEHGTYPPSLAALGLSGDSSGSPRRIGIDFASGRKAGFLFMYDFRPNRSGGKGGYVVYADPYLPGMSRGRHFYTDQTGVVRAKMGHTADANSPPVAH